MSQLASNSKSQSQSNSNSKPLHLAPIHALVDMDAFECQVYSLLHPEILRDLDLGLDGAGGRGRGHSPTPRPFIIFEPSSSNRDHMPSISYEARAYGINRKDNWESALEKCPHLRKYSSVDITVRRSFSQRMEECVRRQIAEEFRDRVHLKMAGYEEFFLEIQEEVQHRLENPDPNPDENPGFVKREKFKTVVIPEVNDQNCVDRRVEIGLEVVSEVLERIKETTGLDGSAGLAVAVGVGGWSLALASKTKTVAKLACPLNKPKGVTAVVVDVGLDEDSQDLDELLRRVEIPDAPGLKGKTGEKVVELWTKPDGSRLETLLDLKRFVKVEELKARGFLKKPNKELNALVLLWGQGKSKSVTTKSKSVSESKPKVDRQNQNENKAIDLRLEEPKPKLDVK